jgi:hypothetical protein
MFIGSKYGSVVKNPAQIKPSQVTYHQYFVFDCSKRNSTVKNWTFFEVMVWLAGAPSFSRGRSYEFLGADSIIQKFEEGRSNFGLFASK